MGWPTLIKCKTKLNKTEKYIKVEYKQETKRKGKCQNSFNTHLFTCKHWGVKMCLLVVLKNIK